METFDPEENNKEFGKIFWITGGIVLIAASTALFLILGPGSKKIVNEVPQSELIAPATSTEEQKLLSATDVASFQNYFWPGKVNTKYPAGWELSEILAGDEVAGLKITPPTDNPADDIYIGGQSATCTSVLQYEKHYCLRNKIKVPFYTNSQNEKVLAAFNLILENTILTEESK